MRRVPGGASSCLDPNFVVPRRVVCCQRRVDVASAFEVLVVCFLASFVSLRRLCHSWCLGGLTFVAFAVNLCVVFDQQVAKLTFGGKVFETLVAVMAFVAVW